MPNQVMCEAGAFVRVNEIVISFMKSYLSATHLANLFMKEEEAAHHCCLSKDLLELLDS